MDKQSAHESRQTDTVSAVASTAGRKSQKGASAIEYVMIIAVIVIAIALAFTQTGLGPAVTSVFTEMGEQLDTGD
ncbi:hypothetical protein K8B33_08200 [Alcanivorax sp. JB21]|uniref:hypothetical protein n=1 Tax=Alcanivorax limicola TaxID=2874102 RepID=UPI001CBE7024|nr:hypothetical protein [Alcanivorax limicola]MBZ2189075.1 hypothetical protein [Alcanivorax limicola]